MTYSWAILVVMMVGIALWQLGMFDVGGVTGTTSTGFPRLKAQLTLMKVSSDGHFTGTFTNAAGGSITVGDAWGTCDYRILDTQLIPSNGNFRINGSNCNITGRQIGDPYELDLYISYNFTLGESEVEHTEYGTLRGPMDL